MKIAIVMALTLVSLNTFASDCSETALKIAQFNLDQKALAYGFEEGSSINADTLTTSEELAPNSNQIYSVEGYIYKATYNVSVELDSLCGVESVKIQENL